MQDALRDLGPEEATDYLYDVISPILEKAPYARPTGDLSRFRDGVRDLRIKVECFFPYPTEDCRFEQAVMNDIGSAMNELTTDMIRAKQLPETTKKHIESNPKPAIHEISGSSASPIINDAARRFAALKNKHEATQEAPF